MISKNTTINDLLQNEKIFKLKAISFKSYLFLVVKAGDARVITNFSIRKQAKEWGNSPELKLTSNKDTVSAIIKELEESGLVKANFDSKILIIL